jgi:hypothetical protein
MTMPRILALAAAASLIAVLTACDPGAPTPSDSDSATPVATASPTREATADRPVPRFGDGCAALVPDVLITALVPGAADPHDLLATQYAAFPVIPRNASIAQVGGMLCEWSNGVPYSSATGASGFAGIQLSVLPDAATGWEALVAYYGYDPVAGNAFCYDEVCGFDVFADGYWFSAEMYLPAGGGTLANVEALAGHLRGEAAGFGAPAAPLSPPGEPVTDDCAVLIPAALVEDVYGAGHSLSEESDGGGWSLWAEASQRNQDSGCGWYSAAQVFAVEWLNGGAWLAAELGATAGTPVAIAELAEGDSATLECVSPDHCRVTLTIDGTWITATAQYAADTAAAATRLAEHLVGVLG